MGRRVEVDMGVLRFFVGIFGGVLGFGIIFRSLRWDALGV